MVEPAPSSVSRSIAGFATPLGWRIAGAILAVSTSVLLIACLSFLAEQWRTDPTRLFAHAPVCIAVDTALVFVSGGLAWWLGRALPRGVDALIARQRGDEAQLRYAMTHLAKARDAAEAANAMKSQFLANMSHEIRTPLNGVLATLEILALTPCDDVQRERLEMVRQSAKALQAILNDVLDVSKIEAGLLTLETETFDPAEVARGAIGVFTVAAQTKGLTLDLEIASPLARRCGDEARLRQILLNLVSNAVKFTDRGRVSLSLRDGAAEDGEALEISVCDTGVGLTPEVLPNLFIKFVQGDATTTRRFGGAGLGLAICHELVSLMHGRIWGEARPGGGAVFRVVLPLDKAQGEATEHAVVAEPAPVAAPAAVEALPPATPKAPTPPPRVGDRLRVLAAEDNVTNQRVLATVIELFGMELEIAPDGAKALEAWRTRSFDVVLMDIQMPVMDGVAATRAIRAQEAQEGLPRTPIIALSANAMPHQIAEYMAAGMDLYVAKPIELTRLRDALDAATRLQIAA